MAGAGRGRQQDGNLVKIILSNGLPVFCAIYHGKTVALGQCVECGYFPEELYFLSCRHALCQQCFHASTQYVCKVDKTVTKIRPKDDRTHSSLNLRLQKIALECPYCSHPLAYRNIKMHIEISHMELLEQEHPHLKRQQVPKPHLSTSASEEPAAGTLGKCVSQQAAPQSSFTRQSEATPKQGEDKWQLPTTPVGYQGNASYSHRSQACGRETMVDSDSEMLTDDDSSDTTSLGERDKEYGIKGGKSEEIVSCPHCITACAASEIEEHKEKCPEREVNCHGCNEVITAKNYDKHMETHYRAGQTRCKEDEAQEAVNGAPESRWDAKKYIENILRQKKQLGDNPSVSVEDREKLIAELQERQKEGNDRNKHRNELPAAIHSVTAITKKENPGTRGIKKEDEPPTRPMPEPEGKGDPHSSGTNYKYAPPEAPVPNAEQQDVDEEMKKRMEVIALKQRIKPPRHDTTSHEVCRKHIELLQDEIRLLKEEKGTLEVSVQDLKEAVYNLQTIVQKLESSEEQNAKDMAKLEDEQRSASTHRIKLEELTQKHDSDTQNLQSSVEGLQTTVEDLQATVQELLSSEEKNVKATDSETCVQKLKVELRMDRLLPVFEHIWKLQPYSALRKSLLFNNATLSTGVLSVNTPGYKIELMLSIKGDYREWRRQLLKDESNCTVPAPQLDAMLRIHQGEDDDLLAWPFKNKISLLLFNHLDEGKSKLLELGSGVADGDWFKKPKRGASNPMFGFSGVIKLPDLENGEEGFLFHDCIVLKLTVHRRE